MAITHLEPKLDCDVIVIGAGPAGAAAAYYMAKAGLRVIVLDEQNFPSDRTLCHLISPGALRELQKIGVANQPRFEASNVIECATVYLSGKELVSGSFPLISEDLPQYARFIPRTVLESLMIEAARGAGAAVVGGFHVINFAVEKDWVTVLAENMKETRTFRAHLLVGAEGSGSSIARSLKGAPWSKVERAAVARAHFTGVTGVPNEASLFFGNDSFPGYSWLFPTGKGEAEVGVGFLLGAKPEIGNAEEILKKLIEEDEGIKSHLKDARLTSDIEVCELNTHDPQTPLAGERVMLIGVAAGLVNPFNGEGVQLALISAKLASETAVACMQNGDFSGQTLAAYAQKVQDEFGYGFKLSQLTLQLIRNRNLNRAWLKWLELQGQRAKTDPEFAYLAAGIFSGMIFPDEGVAARVLTETFEDAAITAGLTVLEGIQDPTNAQQSAVNVIQAGSEVAQYAVQNPFGLLAWCTDVAVQIAEIAASSIPKQALKDVEKEQNNPQ